MEYITFTKLNHYELKELIKEGLEEILEDFKFPVQDQAPTPQLPEIMTVEEVCEFLNLAKPTIYTLTSKREIPYFKKGKRLYFKRQELLTWIEQGKQKSKDEIDAEAERYLAKRQKG